MHGTTMKLLIVPGLWEFSLPRVQEELGAAVAVAGPGEAAEDLLQQHKPDHVIGHSTGCLRAAAIADQVQSVVLCCGFAQLHPIVSEVLQGWAVAPPELQPLLMRPWLFTQDGLKKHDLKAVPSADVEAHLNGAAQLKDSKQANALIVAAQYDLLSTPQDTARLVDLFPHARLEVLNSAHGAPLEHAEELQDVLISFYRRQSVRLGVRQNV